MNVCTAFFTLALALTEGLPAPGSSAVSPARQGQYPSSESFEPDAQKELFEAISRALRAQRLEPDTVKIPIFVITCDRITVLIKSLLSYYTRVDTPIEVVIHDNHTIYPPTVEFINRLEQAGIKVYRHDGDVTQEEMLNNIKDTIFEWYRLHDAPYYVVTDPDIEIEEDSRDILVFFAQLLNENSWIPVIGPMLRRDNLPDTYPLRDLVQRQQAEVYQGLKIWPREWNGEVIGVHEGWIDTAFGMYRKNFTFHRLNRALQPGGKYQARHLDWYINPQNLAPDQIYYWNKNSPVGHWSSSWLR